MSHKVAVHRGRIKRDLCTFGPCCPLQTISVVGRRAGVLFCCHVFRTRNRPAHESISYSPIVFSSILAVDLHFIDRPNVLEDLRGVSAERFAVRSFVLLSCRLGLRRKRLHFKFFPLVCNALGVSILIGISTNTHQPARDTFRFALKDTHDFTAVTFSSRSGDELPGPPSFRLFGLSGVR